MIQYQTIGFKMQQLEFFVHKYVRQKVYRFLPNSLHAVNLFNTLIYIRRKDHRSRERDKAETSKPSCKSPHFTLVLFYICHFMFW